MRATERIALLENENATLRKNVKDLQKELTNANKRIAELVANNKNKQEALLDVVKILNEGLNKHGKET
jgi:predicted nuclease with TOPRIM domain